MNEIDFSDMKALQSWENILGNNNIKWDQVFKHIGNHTINTKVRNFQYKLLHRILPTNKILHKMNIRDNSICNFCNAEEDSIIHYLIIKQFWNEINRFINIQLSLDINIARNNVILNDTREKSEIINPVILLAKYYIHVSKWMNTSPSIDHFINYMNKQEFLERKIAFNQDKLHIHYKKMEGGTE